MPTPQEAAQILRDAMKNGFNPIRARRVQEELRRTMEHNIDLENEDKAAAVQIDPITRQPRGRRMFAGATPSDVRNIQSDLNDDSTFGVDEQDRIKATEDAITGANITQREDVGEAAKTTANRNAFAEFMKNRGAMSGKLSGEVTDEGRAALDAESRRKQAENTALAQGRMGRSGMPIARLNPGDDPLEGLSAQQAEIAQRLSKYDLPVTGTQLRTPEWQDLAGRAMLLDPSFNPSMYESRQKLRADFVAGKSGQNVQSLATVQDHLDALRKKADALDNYGNQPANQVANWFAKMGGGKAIQGYEFDRDAVANELSASLKSSGSTDQEIAGWRERLSSSQSPEQFRETFQTAADLTEKRLNEARQRYESGMGKTGSFNEFMKRTEERAGRNSGR